MLSYLLLLLGGVVVVGGEASRKMGRVSRLWKVSVMVLGVAFGCNISLNNFSLSLVAISSLGEAE